MNRFRHILSAFVVLGAGCADTVGTTPDGIDIETDAGGDSAYVMDAELPVDDAGAEHAPPRAVMPQGICAESLARGAVNDEYFPRMEGEPWKRIVYIEDFFDPDTEVNDFNKWQRVRSRHSLIGAYYMEDNEPGESWSTTRTYARPDASQPFTLQMFLRTAEGWDTYISQFSVLINGRPVEAPYRQMSLDGTEVLQESVGGIQAFTDGPYVAFEVTFSPEQLPANEVVDINVNKWIRPYDQSDLKAGPTSFPSRITLYNGGNSWPDETVTFYCPPDGERWSDYEKAFITEAFTFQFQYLYFPDLDPLDHAEFIEVDDTTVDLWHMARPTDDPIPFSANYSHQLFVNGIPQGEPLFVHDPPYSYGGEVVMRRKLTVELDPDREVNIVRIASFEDVLEPKFTALGRNRDVSTGSFTMSNILYLKTKAQE